MDRFTQGVVKVWFTAGDEGKTINGVVAVAHEHPDVIKNVGGEADILHVVKARVEFFGKTAQGERFAHAGPGGVLFCSSRFCPWGVWGKCSPSYAAPGSAAGLSCMDRRSLKKPAMGCASGFFFS